MPADQCGGLMLSCEVEYLNIHLLYPFCRWKYLSLNLQQCLSMVQQPNVSKSLVFMHGVSCNDFRPVFMSVHMCKSDLPLSDVYCYLYMTLVSLRIYHRFYNYTKSECCVYCVSVDKVL